PHMFSMLSFAVRLTRAALLFVIAVLIAVAFPGALMRIVTYLVNRPGLSALGGLALLLGFVPLCVLLAVTIIGIPLIPVAVMLLVALFLFGFTVSAAWLGERLPVSQEHRTPGKSVAWGAAILVVVSLIPWIGTAALIIVAAMAAGATMLSRFGRRAEIAGASARGGWRWDCEDDRVSRVALVTGGGRGIGRAIALRLAADGLAVAVAARSRDQVDDTARAAGARALALMLDVTDAASIATALER